MRLRDWALSSRRTGRTPRHLLPAPVRPAGIRPPASIRRGVPDRRLVPRAAVRRRMTRTPCGSSLTPPLSTAIQAKPISRPRRSRLARCRQDRSREAPLLLVRAERVGIGTHRRSGNLCGRSAFSLLPHRRRAVMAEEKKQDIPEVAPKVVEHLVKEADKAGVPPAVANGSSRMPSPMASRRTRWPTSSKRRSRLRARIRTRASGAD